MSAAPIRQGSHALAELRDLTECRCPADYKNRGRVACDCNHAYREDVDELAAALAASEARVKCLHGGNVPLQQVVDELRARAEAAEQSLAEARKDAARYRWLRDPTQPLRDALCADDLMAEELDAAIDALLPKGEGETS